jgi:histidinol phosphatase-like enzyme (inositol monophosphatase family)
MTTRPRVFLQAVADIARIAGDVALRHFGTTIDVETKIDGSPVTVADRAAERAAREWIARNFPSHAIIGEEFGSTGNDMTTRWLIDPIDGTKSFVRGVPLWGTIISVVDGDDVVAGAVNCAAAGLLVAAARGEGCWCNGSRCTVSTVSELHRATVLATELRFESHPMRAARWHRLVERADVARTWGDCFGYVLVATGQAEVMADNRVAPWDSAALGPIVEEAGGVVTDWSGRRTSLGPDVIATNASLSDVVRQLLHVGHAPDQNPRNVRIDSRRASPT